MNLSSILLAYLVIMIWANTLGLGIIFVVNDIIEDSLRDRGYTNIPMQLEDKIKKYSLGVLKFIFIPFYYCFKGINLAKNYKSIIKDKIKNGEVLPFIKKKKEIKKETKVEVPEYIKESIEPIKYKAITNGKSLYDGKRENNIKYKEESIEQISLESVTPFAKKEHKINKEDELFDYISSLNEIELEELIKSLEAFKNANKTDVMNTYKLILERDEKVA